MGWREKLAAWAMPDGRVAVLERENAIHRSAAEGRWRDHLLLHAGAPQDSSPGFEIVMKGPFGSLLAEHMALMLESVGAENWVETRVTHPKHGPMVFCVSRERGETQADQIAKLKAELAAARERSEHLSPPSSEEDGPGMKTQGQGS